MNAAVGILCYVLLDVSGSVDAASFRNWQQQLGAFAASYCSCGEVHVIAIGSSRSSSDVCRGRLSCPPDPRIKLLSKDRQEDVQHARRKERDALASCVQGLKRGDRETPLASTLAVASQDMRGTTATIKRLLILSDFEERNTLPIQLGGIYVYLGFADVSRPLLRGRRPQDVYLANRQYWCDELLEMGPAKVTVFRSSDHLDGGSECRQKDGGSVRP